MNTQNFSGERIAKAMARAGVASRRQAETLIAAGRVSVNGKVISSPALNVTGSDRIAVDGEPMRTRERTRLFLYNKPSGLVTTHADPEGRPTIFAMLPKHLPRVISIGRLDLTTEGLLLLTNDGGLARALELPATGWQRRYRVRAYGRITQERLDSLRKGVTVEGVQYGAIEATIEHDLGANVWIAFNIREGKNREVRNVMRHLGLQVNRLIRVAYGPFELGDLRESSVQEVETDDLKRMLGPEIVKQSGADFAGPLLDHSVAVEAAVDRKRDRERVRKQKQKHERFSTSARGDKPVFKPRRKNDDDSKRPSTPREKPSRSGRSRRGGDRSRGPRPANPKPASPKPGGPKPGGPKPMRPR